MGSFSGQCNLINLYMNFNLSRQTDLMLAKPPMKKAYLFYTSNNCLVRGPAPKVELDVRDVLTSTKT